MIPSMIPSCASRYLVIKTSQSELWVNCIQSKLKRPERRQWRRSDVFTVNFDHIPKVILVFPLFSLNNTRHMMV